MIKKILPFVLGFVIIFSTPTLALAWSVGDPLVPPCNKGTVGTMDYADPCDFNDALTLINNIIDFMLKVLAFPLCALIIVYAGFLYIGDMGSSEKKTKAKKILVRAVVGFIIALAAWLIVKTILTTLGYNPDAAFQMI